ncbi:unnamed protein product, partial [Staurois parvus]
MHSLQKKKKTFLELHTKLSMCMLPWIQSVSGGYFNKRRGREERIKQPFYTMQRINPLRFHSEYNKHALLHIQTDFTVVGL